MRTRVAALLAGFVAVAGVAGAVAAPAFAGIGYKIATLPVYGGEPSIAVSPQGVIYDTTPSGGTIMFRSNDGGKTWHKTTTADSASGDDCVSTDQSGAVYLCNLAGSPSAAPLQADVWKSINEGKTWAYGNNTINLTGGNNFCGTSCQPFGVDRDWADAYIPKGKTTKQAVALLMYHDFYGPSSIWVNISTDGGKTFGPSENIFQHAVPSSGAAYALASSACNTVPIGARIVKSGKHAGRMYVAWIASDPESLVTGCNISMAQSFHNVFVAWSDDKGATWNFQLAFDAGIGRDISTPFSSFTLDNQGNPYVAFNSPAPGSTPNSCAAESIARSQNTDPACAYHMWVVWSKDGGQTWDGGGGLLSGTAATAYEVDPSTKPQTDMFPAIAAGEPGKVGVAWLKTNVTEPTDVLGKFLPGGCAGPSVNPASPAVCQWQLFAAQSLNLTQSPGKQTWKTSQLTSTPMHVGDICNLGIACIPGVSNRNLLDFISEALDPTKGCVHIAYADDNKVGKLRVANQVSGPSIRGGRCTLRTHALRVSPKHHHHAKHHHHKSKRHRRPAFTG